MITTYQIHRGLVPAELCLAVRRRLLLELRRCGVKPDEILEWASGSWWPSLRFEPEILDVCGEVERLLGRTDLPYDLAWAEPQILIRLPDEDDVALGPPHTDTLDGSPWLGEWRYRRIFGVECTDTPALGGSTVLYPVGAHALPARLRTGDVLEMHPELLHSGSPNHSADIRIALFFRLLERA